MLFVAIIGYAVIGNSSTDMPLITDILSHTSSYTLTPCPHLIYTYSHTHTFLHVPHLHTHILSHIYSPISSGTLSTPSTPLSSGTFLTARLGRTLVGQYYKKLQREADFRFGLIRTRENAEGIAFYDSEAKLEQINLWTLFERVVSNQLGIIKTQRNLELFTTSYDYLVFVIPYLVSYSCMNHYFGFIIDCID